MLSRSSSAYQPLGGGTCNRHENDTEDETKGTEMTSIAIIRFGCHFGQSEQKARPERAELSFKNCGLSV